MATLTVLADRGDGTIIPPASNSFEISSVIADRCNNINRKVDSRAYYEKLVIDGGDGTINPTGKEVSGRKAAPPVPPSNTFKVGDIIYSDEALTILYNEGLQRDYSINGGSFVTLDKGSTVINQACK
jgi:hypothetical protein